MLKDKYALARIMEQAERVKIELTKATQTEINLPYITMTPEKGPLHIAMGMTRTKLDSLMEPHLKKMLPVITRFFSRLIFLGN